MGNSPKSNEARGQGFLQGGIFLSCEERVFRISRVISLKARFSPFSGMSSLLIGPFWYKKLGMDILSTYRDLLALIDGTLFLLAAALFFLGIFCAPIIVRKQIRPLLWYPLWIWRVIQRHMDPNVPFLRLWALIFSLNSISLFCNLVSGLFIIFPPFFAFLLGLHIAVICLKEVGNLRLFSLILNPVSLLELPAAWISLSLGMSLGRELYLRGYTNVFSLFRSEFMGYLFLVLPLLAVAALVEVSLIKALGNGPMVNSGLGGESGQE